MQTYGGKIWGLMAVFRLRQWRGALVDSSSAFGRCAGLVCTQQEGENDEPHRHPRQLHVDVLVTLRLGLHVELVINARERQAFAVGRTE